MSTSQTFKYRGPDKRCPFPDNRDEMNAPFFSGASVPLTASAGDEGLGEACRLWWLLETISFSASCTFSSPTQGTTSLSLSSSTQPAVGGFPRFLEPVDRVGSVSAIAGEICGIGSTSGSDEVYVKIYYSGGSWRLSASTGTGLYYSDLYSSAYYDISDASIGSGFDGSYYSVANSGDVTILGYTFPTRFTQVSADSAGLLDWSISGQSMSLTGTFYTLV